MHLLVLLILHLKMHNQEHSSCLAQCILYQFVNRCKDISNLVGSILLLQSDSL